MSELVTLLETGAPLAAVTGGAMYARQRTPRTYWSTVGLPAAMARIVHHWADTMEACGLTVEPSMWQVLTARRGEGEVPHAVPPRFRGIRPSTIGLRIRLRLARGQCTEDVQRAADALRHAWKVQAVYVSEVRPGTVDLHILGFDVLRRVVLPSRTVAKQTQLLRIPVALRENGTVFVRDYRTMPNGLTLGALLSGKSMFGRNLFTGLAPQPVAIVGIDCKRGVEHTPFSARLSALAVDPDSSLDLLRVLIAEMETRFDLIRSQWGIPSRVPDEEIATDIWSLPAHLRPAPIVTVIDEIAELFLFASSAEEKRRNELVTLMVRHAQLSRAAGMYLEVMGQRFGSELGKGATMLRAQLSHRIVHRVNDLETARMGLGDITEEGMHASTLISADQPGTAIAGDAAGRWSRIRTPYRSLTEASAYCARFAHMVPDLPALAPFRPLVPEPAPVDASVLVKPLPATD
ncbi:S-DNA-T family DNA segregation ATPase FtsK/SpoIIIE [Streptacidiphilus sp. MAP12-16]|uniref:FtsK/SpoIIIE domain-containing protein n=1 Tax=Streptacidiphilus sp. MAP12-16 TaxID=3156300 RepID=UPI003519110B